MDARIEKFRADRDTLVWLAESLEVMESTYCGKVWSHEEAQQTDGDGSGDDVRNPVSVSSISSITKEDSQPK